MRHTNWQTAILLSSILHIPLVTSVRAEKAIELKQGPHLFLDDHLIAHESNIKRVIQEPPRLPEPVVTGPEDKCFQPYFTILRDPESKRFRIWYGVPESSMQSHVGYMESEDGIKWIRPHRVLKDPARIQFGVAIIDEGPGYKDKSQRYKYGWHDQGGLMIAVSPDGLDWKCITEDEPVVKHSHDINYMWRDPIRNRYIGLVSEMIDKRRTPHQSVSEGDDIKKWKKPWQIVTIDEKDEGDTQFYCMGGLIARGPLLIGMLRVLRDDLPADEGGDVKGIGYTVLAWSHDGENWQRDREPFLPRNPKSNTWDHAMTWGDCQLIVGDETYIYYGGYARGHKVERYTERQIGLARMPLDRYVAREAGEAEGVLRTRPVVLEGKGLTINADVKGELRARVLDEKGRALAGLDWDDAEPIKGDNLRHPLRWKKEVAPPRGAPIQIEFKLKDTKLYAINVN